MPSTCGYSRSGVANVLGLLGMVLFIVAIVSLAAAVTWLVVRFSPRPSKQSPGS
jgi:hypothetical protein